MARFWVGGAGTWDAADTTHWAATSGGAGGQSVPGTSDDVTIDAASGAGTITVNTNFSVLSLTCGAMGMTLDFSANNNSPTFGTFSATGTGVRTISAGSGTFTITGNNAAVLNLTVSTNLTVTANTSTWNLTYSGSTGTRQIFGGSALATPLFNTVNVQGGTDALRLQAATYTNLNLTGYAGTLGTGSTQTIYGTLTATSAMSVGAFVSALSFVATSGTQTITSGGFSWNSNITFNGVGGTWSLADAISTSGSITLTNGTFTANNKNVTAGSFSSSNSNTRTLTMGGGIWTLTGTGNVWAMGTVTGLTLNANTSTIKITDTSSTAKNFVSGNVVYNNLWFTGGTGTLVVGTSASTNTFNNFKVEGGATVQIFSGKTIVASSITWSGTIGARNTFNASTGGSAWTISIASGNVSQDWISLQDSTATGGATFYAGAHSIDVSGNTGWIFSFSPVDPLVAVKDGNGVNSLLGTLDEDGDSVMPILADPTTHKLSVSDGTTGSDLGPASAPRDQNFVTALMAVSSDDGRTPVAVYADVDGNLLVDST